MLGNFRSTCHAVLLVTTVSSFGGHWGYADAAHSWVEGIAGSAGFWDSGMKHELSVPFRDHTIVTHVLNSAVALKHDATL